MDSAEMSNTSGYNTSNTLSATGSSQNATGNTRATPRILTIERPTRIDTELKKNRFYKHRPSQKVVYIKWISTFIIAALLLAFVTQSKISIIAISESMNTHAQTGNPNDTQTACREFVMLFLLVLIPNCVNFIRGVWGGLFRKDIPWPKKSALLAGLIVSALETFGICIFVLKMPALTKPYIVILLMSCVFVVPMLVSIIKSCVSERQSKMNWCFWGLAFVSELIGIGLTVYMWIQTSSTELKDIWYPLAGVVCLSVAWVPEIQSFLLRTKTSTNGADDVNVTPDPTYLGSDQLYDRMNEEVVQDHSGQSTDSHEQPDARTSVTELEVIALEKPTWKMIICTSFCKIVFTFVFSFVLLRWSVFSTGAADVFEHFRLGWSGWEDSGIYFFIANCSSSILGYILGFIACTTCMQRGSYVVPLSLATPLAAVLFAVRNSCVAILIGVPEKKCDLNETLDIIFLILAVVCLVVGHVFSYGYLIFTSHSVVKQNETQLFWLPAYNSALLEQWLLLSKRTEHNDEGQEDPVERAKRTRVIICTTMYREADYEMRQLLESLNGVNNAQGKGHRHFESHVFFDGAVKDRNPTDFVLQLVALVDSTLGIRPEMCSKVITPYGMSLSWKLNGEHGMIFKIHLKDNFKVKNKKRWSQIMYMSYVLDYLMLQEKDVTDEETFILTTDADVRFTPDAVEALLDLMTRDPSVGAVCARTHPLGSGPMVWYQVFEYALGHWFQKAAEHVIGSVLCSPGCFSVYRCKALRDVLPKYATNVEHAFEFLTKDMGEDRWLCTLMVQTGWRIEYCAASENSTHCPEEFEEFYKQRRRWVASTLANMMLLMKEWSIVAKFNHRVSVFFLLYQAALLFATLIGPSSVILVVSGGLVYGMDIDTITSLVLQLIICVGFTLICLMASAKTQLTIAKLLTFFYSVVMTAVVVGTAVQVATDFSKGEPVSPSNPNETVTTTMNPNFISGDIQVSTTTVYLGTMAGIFIVAGILHLKEVIYLAHGVWYLLCLPSGYLILTLYSICNITDRSWGTREAQTKSVITTNKSWQQTLQDFFKNIFFCCFTPVPETSTSTTQTEIVPVRHRPARLSESESDPGSAVSQRNQNIDLEASVRSDDITKSVDSSRYKSGDQDGLETLLEVSVETERRSVIPEANEEIDEDEIDGDTIIDVHDWLQFDLRDKYSKMFRDNGYDNTMLISGMTEKELKDIGIKTQGTKQKLLQEIQLLPNYDIPADVPVNVKTWLENIGLPQYTSNFVREQINSSKEMEILKSFGRNEIEKELKITKKGHIKRLLYAIKRLRNPTAEERKIIETRKAIDQATLHHLKNVNGEENDFWEHLKNKCLLPSSTVFGLEEDLKQKLGDLRNQWLMVFAVSNTLWLILISTLANQGKLLNVFGSNAVGFVVLILFTFVLIIQFLAMIVHRVGTLTHFLGRAPYRGSEAYNSSWAFNDGDMALSKSLPPEDREARRDMRRANQQAQRRLRRGKKRTENPEKQPLLNSHNNRQRVSMV